MFDHIEYDWLYSRPCVHGGCMVTQEKNNYSSWTPIKTELILKETQISNEHQLTVCIAITQQI